MSTIASLNLVLSAQTKELDGGIDKATARVKRFGSDLEQFKKKAESGGGIFGGMSKSIREFASGGAEGAAMKGIGRLLKGGGAVMGIRAIGDEAQRFAEGIAKVQKDARNGASKGDIFQGVAESIPVLGEAWKAGTQLGDALRDGAAAIALSAGASERLVDSLKSGTTLLKEQQERYEAIGVTVGLIKEGIAKKQIFSSPIDLRAELVENQRFDAAKSDVAAKIRANAAQHGGMNGGDRKALSIAIEGETAEHEDRLLQIRQSKQSEYQSFIQQSERRIAETKFAASHRQLEIDGNAAEHSAQIARKSYADGISTAKEAAIQFAKSQPTRAIEAYVRLGLEWMALRQKLQLDLKLPDLQKQAEARANAIRGYIDTWKDFQAMGAQFNTANTVQGMMKQPREKLNVGQLTEMSNAIQKLKDNGVGFLAPAFELAYRNLQKIGDQNQSLQRVRDTLESIHESAAKAGLNPQQQALFDLQKNHATPMQLFTAAKDMRTAQIWDGAARTKEETRTPMERLNIRLGDLRAQHEAGAIDDDTFKRGVKAATKDTNAQMGLTGEPQRVGAMEMRHGFSVNAEPQIASPAEAAAEKALKESKTHTTYWNRLLSTLQNNVLSVISLDNLPSTS